jgi:hypothetical protein
MPHPKPSYKDADWYACPECGAEVRVGSRGCTACHGKSWEQDEYLDGLDLPEDPAEFNYDEFVKREFGRGSARVKPAGLAWKWWITGVLLLSALIGAWILRL